MKLRNIKIVRTSSPEFKAARAVMSDKAKVAADLAVCVGALALGLVSARAAKRLLG